MEDTNGRREMGALAAQVKSLAENQAEFRLETRADLKAIFAKLEAITAGGCAVGQRNTERIKELEHRPEKQTAWAANLASIVAAGLAALAFWRAHQ